MQPRAACYSKEHSHLVALRDGCCDNDDRLVATYRSHALRNTCLYGSVSGSVVSLVVRVGTVCLVEPRHGRCDNDDVIFESITFSYIGILYGIFNAGALWQPWCRSWFERVQFAWSRFVTVAVTMSTRHSIASRSDILGNV